jgi:hypothetical protein
MFHATGLTASQQALVDEQAAGEPVAPSPEPPLSTEPPAPASQAQSEEVASLKDQAADLFRSLQDIQTRLAELEGQAEENSAT